MNKNQPERRTKKLNQDLVRQLIITVDQTTTPASVMVAGVPTNLSAALQHINAGYEAIVRMFIDKAQKGELNNGCEIATKPENLIIPVGGSKTRFGKC